MLLTELLADITSVPARVDRAVTGLQLDSRKIHPGDVFIALAGTQQHGREYIAQAIQRGAVTVFVAAQSGGEPIQWQANIPIIPIPALAQQLGLIAARFYDYPAKKLRLIGVTGTSGKTSCTHFIAQILAECNIPCGIIGTLGSGFYGTLGEAGLTTPDPITLHATLHQFVLQGAKAIAMEVSSHSIEQGRINGIDFEVGVFTNLSQDHLDYHQDMPTYAAVKRRFMAEFPTKTVILNADDYYGQQWLKELAPHKKTLGYTTRDVNAVPTPMLSAQHIQLTLQGIKAHVQTPWQPGDLRMPLIGEFNLSNGLAVLATLGTMGMPVEEALMHMAALKPVAGRMQTLGGNGQPLVVVDYAHKPDALEKVLQALRAHTEGRIACVFGCGGERDRGKRPLMAKIAERLADHVIVTNDNPRHEQPEAIATEIFQGFTHPERISIELDRSKAIQNSIQWASAKDCVLVAGKGAEHYQQFGDQKLPFDDVLEVQACLERNQ